MSFLDHLEDLRWHLIRSCLSILVLASIAFIAKDFIFDTIIFGPKKIDFPTYQWFCNLSRFFGQGDFFCITEMPFRIQSRTVAGQFSAHLWTSILAGFIIAFPYVIFEFWRFVSPGLHDNERKNARGFISIASLLFFVGVLCIFLFLFSFDGFTQQFRVIQDFYSSGAFQGGFPGVLLGDAFTFFGLVAAGIC